MNILLNIIIATFSITLCVSVAVIFLYFKKEFLNKITLFLVALSAGALMGGAFLHLLPEAAEKLPPEKIYPIVLIAFIFFFFMERILYWRHCHQGDCKIHTFAYMNLVGDSLHNFIDGLVIASTFLIDFKLGIITTLAIALHEIPQEIGDFGVLVHAGFNKQKALIINYLVALIVIVGGLAGYYIAQPLTKIIPYLLPFAAGGFLYIAASDLIPEIIKQQNLKNSILNFLIFISGIAIMSLIKIII